MQTVKLKFTGTFKELQHEVKHIGVYGNWRDLGNRKQFVANSGVILTWRQSTGTISFQGSGPGLVVELEAAEFEAKLFLRAEGADEAPDSREIIPAVSFDPDKIDWTHGSLIDDHGQRWVDLILCRGGGEPKIGGKIKPIIVCGRRAPPIKPSGHLRIVK